ncbi:uncharacterized protein LOC113507188 isoform X2 [Trichoplusia ni]|nr:uncharacterized protein LOC113500092 isoform X2 [Trichoplusia ni]XP_026744829.1 uncharacterized protein LOC113506176 isoform X2 [Trichoplusia ni]XP_026745852.1 uncharacterized protein LOC113507188 isoform X2 [Trichoplusia ni]
MESRARASPEQFSAILEFMESHGDISWPQQGPQGRIKADRLWHELVQSLNSMGGGVVKPLDKWKKVWADWKTKTKKKALTMRREASGTGGGPSSRLTLTPLEDRVLGIMGLTAVVGQPGIDERGFDAPPSTDTLMPATGEAVQNNMSTQDSSPSVAPLSLPQPSFEFIFGPTPSTPMVVEPGPEPAPSIPPTTSPPVTASRGAPRRRRRPAGHSPASSLATSTPHRRGVFRARTRRIQTPFERATSEFVAIEQRRLQLEESREEKHHHREMERLRLESRRLDIQESMINILSRLSSSVDHLTNVLPLLTRSSSLPSTEIISDV